MKQHLNTLFVTTQGAYLRKNGSTVAVRIEKETRLRVPLHNLDGIVGFGRVTISPALMGACVEAGVAISLLKENGRFLAAVNGFTSGNVLLRRQQYRIADDPENCVQVARTVMCGKLANCRTVLRRAARDTSEESRITELDRTADKLTSSINQAANARQFDDLSRVRRKPAGHCLNDQWNSGTC